MSLWKYTSTENPQMGAELKPSTKGKEKKKDSWEAEPVTPYLDFVVSILLFLDVIQTNRKFW